MQMISILAYLDYAGDRNYIWSIAKKKKVCGVDFPFKINKNLIIINELNKIWICSGYRVKPLLRKRNANKQMS